MSMYRYEKICSEVILNFMFVGGTYVANNANTLNVHGITHIVDCSANPVSNLHTQSTIQYATFPIRDDGFFTV